MPFLVKKKIKNGVYYYLRHNHRVDGKVKTAWQIYLGSEESLQIRSKIANMEYTTETIDFGLVAALHKTAKKLNLVDIINKHTNKREQGLGVGEHLLIGAINRCVQPLSKNQLKDWFDSTILKNYYPNMSSALDSRSFWTHFRYLDDDVIEAIENDFIEEVQNNFEVNINDISFDPTNFYSYINPRDEKKQTYPKHGHSKESRFTLNIINMSLLQIRSY